MQFHAGGKADLRGPDCRSAIAVGDLTPVHGRLLLAATRAKRKPMMRQPPGRQIVMVGFLQAHNCTNLLTSWRHPGWRQDSASPDYDRKIGRALEAGTFHLGFFDDRLAMPDRLGNDHAHTVQYGIRCVTTRRGYWHAPAGAMAQPA